MKKIQQSISQNQIELAKNDLNSDEKYFFDELQKDLKQITSTPHGRRLFLASLPFILQGCASSAKDKTRYREGNNEGQETDLTVEDEKKMAAEYAPQMEKEYPPTSDPYLQKYIKDLGNRIVTDNGLDKGPYDYEFKVVESDMVNAFALPAGRIYVTKPLIKLSQSEAELAGVVGHEIGHVQARHTAERIEKAKNDRTKNILYGLGGVVLGGAAGFGLSRFLCAKEDRECIRRITQYGALAGGAGGLLISKFGFMAHGREDEMEADRIGYKVAVNSGFHKDYAGRFYWRLKEMEDKNSGKKSSLIAPLTDALSTHPPSQERIDQIRSMMAEASNRGKAIISTTYYEKAKSRV